MEALAETHLGRDGGDLRPTTSPSSPGGEQHIHSGDCEMPKQGGGPMSPHPRDGGSSALTWRRAQPGAGSGTWRNPSLRGARPSLPGVKDSALGRGGLCSSSPLQETPSHPAPSRAQLRHPGTAAFTQGLCLPFGRGPAGGSHPGRVRLPARLLRKAVHGALSQRWSKGETQGRG